MNLWDTLEITPVTALLAAGAGLAVAALMALLTFRRGRSAERPGCTSTATPERGSVALEGMTRRPVVSG